VAALLNKVRDLVRTETARAEAARQRADWDAEKWHQRTVNLLEGLLR
jgi:hypothetical protein